MKRGQQLFLTRFASLLNALLDLNEKRTATQTFRKGLIEKLRMEWTKNAFSFLVKVLSFVKERKFEDSNIKPLKRFDPKIKN